MEMALYVVWVTALAGIGGTGLGGLLGAVLRRESGRIVGLLLAFAGGVMLGVVCFDLLPEAIGQIRGPRGLFLGVLGLLAGFLAVELLNLMIGGKQSGSPLLAGGIVMATAIALHNLPEGMVIGAAYAAGEMNPAPFTGGGFAMALVIGLHNVPEGMAAAVPLISGGENRGTAVLITALSGAPTVLGAMLGYHLGSLGPVSLGVSLSFASGAMVYVVFGELLPEAFAGNKGRGTAFCAALGLAVGLMMTYL